jgi:hypothetical protein
MPIATEASADLILGQCPFLAPPQEPLWMAGAGVAEAKRLNRTMRRIWMDTVNRKCCHNSKASIVQ